MIYRPSAQDGFEFINTVDDADYEVFASFDGTPRADTWKPIRVKRVRWDEGEDLRVSDFPWLGSHALVLSERAVIALEKLVKPYGEVLPLDVQDESRLFVLNVLKVVDALDEAGSTLVRFPSSNRIMRVVKPIFRSDAVQGLCVFRLPFRASAIYVSQEFVTAVNAAGLLGLEFQPQ